MSISWISPVYRAVPCPIVRVITTSRTCWHGQLTKKQAAGEVSGFLKIFKKKKMYCWTDAPAAVCCQIFENGQISALIHYFYAEIGLMGVKCTYCIFCGDNQRNDIVLHLLSGCISVPVCGYKLLQFQSAPASHLNLAACTRSGLG